MRFPAGQLAYNITFLERLSTVFCNFFRVFFAFFALFFDPLYLVFLKYLCYNRSGFILLSRKGFMKVLRIVSCILACICVTAVIPVGIFTASIVWCIIPIAAAAGFIALMFVAKKKSEPKPPAAPDFMNSPEENAELNKRREEWDKSDH